MPRESIADYLRRQPDDNLGKICLLKGEALRYRKKAKKDHNRPPKMTDVETNERRKERYKALTSTLEGRQLLRDRCKKRYWQNIELSRDKQRAYRKANKEMLKAKYEAKKQAKIDTKS